MAFMYILKCSDGSFYKGSTINLERRLKLHSSGRGANYTKNRLPIVLVYTEYFKMVRDAFQREKQIQGWSYKKKKALIEKNFLELHTLSIYRSNKHKGNTIS